MHLTPKAFDLLVLLVESAGHLQCRNELIERLWGQTVVEEHSLTWNVSALRRALDDNGETPAYIETVRGHGYRFVAPVCRLEGEDRRDPDAAVPSRVPALHADTSEPGLSEPGTQARPRMRQAIRARPWRTAWIGAGVVLLVLAAWAIGSARLTRLRVPGATRAETGPPAIAVVGFRNLSDNHDLDWIGDALTEMLGTELSIGHMATITPAADVARLRDRSAADAHDAVPTPRQLDVMHRNLGASAMIVGAYLRQGSKASQRIRVDVHLITYTDGNHATLRTLTVTGDDLFELVSRIGRQLRGRLGLKPLDPAQQSEFMASMPATGDAAADYASGLSALASGNALLARNQLERASREEPDFALTHSALARAWLDLGDNHRAAEQARAALRLSAGLSYTQQQLLLGIQAEATHQWSQAIQAYRNLFEANPDSLNYGLMLVRAQNKGGDYAEAGQTLARLRRLPEPFGNDPRVMLAGADRHANLDENQAYYDSAMAAANRATKLGEDVLQAKALSAAAEARIKLNDFDGALALAGKARKLFSASDANHLDAGINLQRIGIAQDSLGHYDQAIAAYQDANELFAGSGNRYWQAVSLNNIAGVYYRRDHLDDAARFYQRALPIFRELHRDAAVATVLNNLSSVVGSQGRVDQAIEYQKQSLALRRALGAPRSTASTLLNLGLDSFRLGRLDDTRSYLTEARDIYLERHAEASASDAISGLADLAFARNQLESAREGYSRALAMRRMQDVATSVAWSQRDLAELDLETHQPRQALKLLQAALPVFMHARTPGDISATRADMVLALIDLNQSTEARRQLGILDTEMKQLDNPVTRIGLDIARASAAGRLGEEARAERLLSSALLQARAMHIKSRIYPARLELARLHARKTMDAGTRNQIRQLVRDSRRDGFLFVAARARQLLASPSGAVLTRATRDI